MAGLPSRPRSGGLLRARSESGFLHACQDPVHDLLRAGKPDPAAQLAHATAELADALADRTTAVTVRLLEGLALLNGGRPAEADAVARTVLSLVDEFVDPEAAEALPGFTAARGLETGTVGPHVLPRYACFWRAEALALRARAAVAVGSPLPAMDHLADALAMIDGVVPVSEDDAACCLVVATVLTSVLLVEPAAELAQRGLACADRLAAGASPTIDLIRVRTALARRYAETKALAAGYMSLGTDPPGAERQQAAAAAAALRHLAAARDSDDPAERDAAQVFLVWAEHGLRQWAPEPLVDLADEHLVAGAAERLGRIVVIGPGRGGALLGRMVLARLLALRGERNRARELLAEDDASVQSAPRGRSPWTGLAGVVRAQIEEDGDHPAVQLWRELAVAAGMRLWRERDARFLDLRQRIVQRQLHWKRVLTEGELMRDPLTGLGNRRRLAAELGREVSSVLFIDIDRFKVINDELSHQVGDLVLRRIAGILRSCCRSPDVLVRYGGDEFVVLLDRGSSVAWLGERVLERVRAEDWSALTGGHRVTVSVGAASALTLQEALRGSDSAMLAAKQAGRDALVVGET